MRSALRVLGPLLVIVGFLLMGDWAALRTPSGDAIPNWGVLLALIGVGVLLGGVRR